MSASKWILGGLGFVLGGPIGALIGVGIASLFDTGSQRAEEYTQDIPHSSRTRTTRATQGDVRVSIIVLLACVIKADGRVLKSEISYIKPFLVRNFGEEGAKQALQLLKQLLEQDINPAQVAQQIRQYVNYSVRLELVHLLLEVAKADGEVVEAETQIIEQIAIHMGISTADYHGVELLQDGRARSINLISHYYDQWTQHGDTLILSGRTLVDDTEQAFTDTMRILAITRSQMVLEGTDFRWTMSRIPD